MALQVAFGASSMVGRTVTYTGAGRRPCCPGVVNSVRFEATGPVLQVDGEDVHFARSSRVGDGSTDLTETTDRPGDDAPSTPSTTA